MKITLQIIIFLLLSLYLACGHDHDHDGHDHGDHDEHSEEGLSAIAEEVCLHLDNGPNIEVNAVANPGDATGAVSLSISHTRYDVTLPQAESGEGYQGVVTFSASEALEFLIATRSAMSESSGISLDVNSAESGTSVIAESLDADEITETCLTGEEAPQASLYPLEVGRYDLVISHDQPLVQLVIETVEIHADEHDH